MTPHDLNNVRLRHLPKVDRVLDHPALSDWHTSPIAADAVRAVLDQERERLKNNSESHLPDESIIAKRACDLLEERFAPQLRPVINGTGVIIHTNLGRAPLSKNVIETIAAIARGYSTLEYDLAEGRRGSRHNLVRESLLTLTGAEDALVVNNNASALLLALTTLSRGRDVLVSRGQLVEIGGSFRIPDICEVSGARLVEVGTTNRTRLSDYERAITDNTGLLLRVHPSNFRVVGFTEHVQLAELVKLGLDHNIPVVDDLGSGALVDITKHTPLPREPLVRESVEAGADVITFSGDKLLGGPQAGLAVGKLGAIDEMRKHPLMRAVRPDKLAFAALDATLREYLKGTHANNLPVWRMLSITVDELHDWLEPLRQELSNGAASANLDIDIQNSTAYSGGGSLPQEELSSAALVFSGEQQELTSLQTRLRLGNPPIIGYLKDGLFHLDARTLIFEDRDQLAALVHKAISS